MQIPTTTPSSSLTRVRISRSTQTGNLPQAAGPSGAAVPGSSAHPLEVEHDAPGAGPSRAKRSRLGAPLSGLLEQSREARSASATALRAVFHPDCGAGPSAVVQTSSWTLKRKPTGGEFVHGILLRLQQMTAHQRDAVVKALELQLFQNGWRIDDSQLNHLAEVHHAVNPRAMPQLQLQSPSPSPSGSRTRPADNPANPAVPVAAGASSARPSARLLPQLQAPALPLPLSSAMPAASMASDLILNLIFSLKPGAVVQPAATLAFFPPVTGDAVLASLVATGVLLQSADGVLRRSTRQAWLSGEALVGTWRVVPDPAEPVDPAGPATQPQ